VDVGHTAESPGAPSARGFWEYDFNLRLATLIKQKLLAAGFGKTVLLVTDGPARKSLFQRVGRANRLSADLFLSIHHDSVPDSFLERWEYEGQAHGFSDRFKGHSIFFSNENVDPAASLLFGQLLGEQLQARGLQYTPHYIEKFMGHRQRLLVDAKVGVYRYDQLIVLRTTQMPDHQSRRGIGDEFAGAPIAHRHGCDRCGRRLLRHTAAAKSRSRCQPGGRRRQTNVLSRRHSAAGGHRQSSLITPTTGPRSRCRPSPPQTGRGGRPSSSPAPIPFHGNVL
jgi:hypothetical protein